MSVQCTFVLCYRVLPKVKPSNNKAVTITIHLIHQMNLDSFLIAKQYVPEAPAHRQDRLHRDADRE